MKVLISNLGYPRLGKNREYKKYLEEFWKGKIPPEEFKEKMEKLEESILKEQKELGVELIPVGDFSYYDSVLDTAFCFGIVPSRFKNISDELELYFAMARGNQYTPPLEMTKWFNTNYHYIVPEIEDCNFNLTKNMWLEKTVKFKNIGNLKPVIIGPVSFVLLSKGYPKSDLKKIVNNLLPIYKEVLESLKDHTEWVQIDEPFLVMEIEAELYSVYSEVFSYFEKIERPKIMLQSYFEDLDNPEFVFSLPVEGVGLDLTTEWGKNFEFLTSVKTDKTIGAGIISGRNVWKANLKKLKKKVEQILEKNNRIWLQPSCSLMFVPLTLQNEDVEIKEFLSFAAEKIKELTLLKRSLTDGEDLLPEVKSLEQFVLPEVRKRIESLDEKDFKRSVSFEDRVKIQKKILNLPLFPTTVIGSFPQTQDVRKTRRLWKEGKISDEEYKSFIKQKIAYTIGLQEGLGIDVLAHGEFERADMVEYFAEKLTGIAVTKNGWIQSYGSRTIRPPIIYGDIKRKEPMTLEFILYAQSLTQKPVKGILTGPVTMIQWSYVREDIDKKDVAFQIALALKDEVAELEHNGIKIIQIDEPALREGLPLKKSKWEKYLNWAIKAFRLATSAVKPETQIHTHMCYSEFEDIMEWIEEMDADVISIETARSRGELIRAFEKFGYSKQIGPGVYDIHSPRVPSVDEMVKIIERCIKVLPKENIWINPDCGLKTRQWNEVIPSLRNMVEAAEQLRKKYGGERSAG